MSSREKPSIAQEAPGVWQRRIEATFPLLLSVFLGSLAFGVSGARVSGPWYLALLLKGFFIAVVGGIAAFCAGIGVQTLCGQRSRGKAAVLYHAGLLGLWYEEALEWRLGSPKSDLPAAAADPSTRHFSSARETLEVCLLERSPSEEMLPLLQLLAPQISTAARPVAELWLAVQSEQALMDQFEGFFRSRELVPELLESQVSLALVRAISARLLN